MSKRVIVPTSAVDIAKAKVQEGNVSTVVPTDSQNEVYYKLHGSGEAGRGGFVVERGQHVKKSHRLGAKATAMKACAGKRGCDFSSCLEGKGITPPRSVRKSCGYGPRRALHELAELPA